MAEKEEYDVDEILPFVGEFSRSNIRFFKLSI